MKYCLFFLVLFTACTDEQRTHETLRKSGFTDIQTTGYDFFSCSDEDTFSTAFVATNPKGERVEGAVCCGIFKNCTIRF